MSLFNALPGQQWWKNTLLVSGWKVNSCDLRWNALDVSEEEVLPGLACLFHHVDTPFFLSLSYLGFALWPRPLRGPIKEGIKEHLTAIRCANASLGHRGGKRKVAKCGHPDSTSHSAPVGFSVWHYRGNQVVVVLTWQACLINMWCAARQRGVWESEEGQRCKDDATLSTGMKNKQTKTPS